MEVRLASIEASTSSFQTEIQKQMAQLDTNIRQQTHDTQNRIHSIGLRFEEHQKEVAQQMLQSAQWAGPGGFFGEDHASRGPGYPWHISHPPRGVSGKPGPEEGQGVQ